MNLRAPAVLLAARSHGENGVIARLLTEEYGMVAAYVAGGRGRQLRPVMIPGNRVAADIRAKSASQLPFAKLELVESRGPWLTEPLPAAAITWVCALTATALPERNAYPQLYSALTALLDAVCNAPSARGWLPAMITFEALLLRELGFGGAKPALTDDLDALMEEFDRLAPALDRYLLAGTKGDVMGVRQDLRGRLARMS